MTVPRGRSTTEAASSHTGWPKGLGRDWWRCVGELAVFRPALDNQPTEGDPRARHVAISALVALRIGMLLLLVGLLSASATRRDLGPAPVETSPGLRHTQNVAASPVLASPDGARPFLQGGSSFCLSYYTGTIRSTFIISNPGGISGLESSEVYGLANVDQRVVAQSATAVELEIAIQRHVDTHAQYPVDVGSLPQDVRGDLLPEDGWIQSDDPEIVAKAGELASGLTFQVEVVEAILAWVRAKVAFDYTSSLPYDALSTFHNRSALCGGFATLSVALMRAADIPARTRIGCLANEGWSVPIQGGWHAWVETYYPDLGWVASDPQTTANFVDTSHIFGGFHQCGQVETVISRTQHLSDPNDDGAAGGLLYSTRTPYTNAPWYGLDAAHVPSLGRDLQLRVTSSLQDVTLPVSSPTGTLSLQIEDLSCQADTQWAMRTETSWLNPGFGSGMASATVPVSIDATGMQPGDYTGTITLRDAASDQATGLAVDVNLQLTGQPQGPLTRLFLPVVLSPPT